VLLHTGAGLLIRSFVHVLQAGTGFDPRQCMTAKTQRNRLEEPEKTVALRNNCCHGSKRCPAYAPQPSGARFPLNTSTGRTLVFGDGLHRYRSDSDRKLTPAASVLKQFDGGGTSEARFAKAIDRCMPILLNLSNQGGSWLENGVTYERVVGRVGPEIENGCPELWTCMKAKLEEARRKGFFAATS
jgi:HD domain